MVEKEDIVKWLNHNIAYSRKHQMGWNRAQSLFFEINQRGVKVLFWTTFLHWQNGLSTVAVILEARSRQVWLLPNEVTHVATRWLVFFFTSFLDIRVLDNKQLNAVKTYDVIGILSLKATAITLVSIVSRWVRGFLPLNGANIYKHAFCDIVPLPDVFQIQNLTFVNINSEFACKPQPSIP